MANAPAGVTPDILGEAPQGVHKMDVAFPPDVWKESHTNEINACYQE